MFQMFLAAVIGVAEYFLRRTGIPVISLLLGFILGPDLELYLRRSLSLNDGDPGIFLTSPDSLFFLILAALFIFLMEIRPRMRGRNTE